MSIEKFKYIVNQFGVVFQFSEDQPLPANAQGYRETQIDELRAKLSVDWKEEPEDVDAHFYFIDVKNETMIGDRGITTDLDKPVLEFVEQYEI